MARCRIPIGWDVPLEAKSVPPRRHMTSNKNRQKQPPSWQETLISNTYNGSCGAKSQWLKKFPIFSFLSASELTQSSKDDDISVGISSDS